MIKEGSWFLRSKKDPRWDCNGEGLVGAFSIPPACQRKIDELKQTLGEPPDDLEWEYMKH